MNTPLSSRAGAPTAPPTDFLVLSPAQTDTYTRLARFVDASTVTVLVGAAGCGKTTVFNVLSAERRTARLGSSHIIEATPFHGLPAFEETLHYLISDALDKADLVLIEDLDLVCYTNKMAAAYPRPFYFQVALQSLFEKAGTRGKRLVISATNRDHLLPVFESRSLVVHLSAFTEGDYRFFLERGLSHEQRSRLDARRIFAAAPKLSASQLLQTCALARWQVALSDEAFIDIVESSILTSNVRLGEVASVTFADLKGFETISDSLETQIVNPLQHGARFADLGLAPKRGVLLFGPPGTGKTSVGRALAHRLRGKFFMIDGSFTSEPPAEFYSKVKQVFERAKHNTPSVIFIDDADVLMQSERVYGLNRYLLSMLDGLESETAGMVTVMVTAMDPNQLQQALLRSGRIELWLETKLPDARARGEILRELLTGLPERFHHYDAERIVGSSEGFNGADVKRLVADAVALYARDVLRGDEPRTTDAYLEEAARGVLANKALVAAAQEGKLRVSGQ